MNRCAWCLEPRTTMEDFHTCPGSQDAKDRMDKEIQSRISSLERVAEGAPRRKK